MPDKGRKFFGQVYAEFQKKRRPSAVREKEEEQQWRKEINADLSRQDAQDAAQLASILKQMRQSNSQAQTQERLELRAKNKLETLRDKGELDSQQPKRQPPRT